MRKVKIEQESVIDSDLDSSINSEQPLSLQKSEAVPEEVIFLDLDPGLENKSKLLGRRKKLNLSESWSRQNKTTAFPIQKEKYCVLVRAVPH